MTCGTQYAARKSINRFLLFAKRSVTNYQTLCVNVIVNHNEYWQARLQVSQDSWSSLTRDCITTHDSRPSRNLIEANALCLKLLYLHNSCNNLHVLHTVGRYGADSTGIYKYSS